MFFFWQCPISFHCMLAIRRISMTAAETSFFQNMGTPKPDHTYTILRLHNYTITKGMFDSNDF
jgi:hypothetical protein